MINTSARAGYLSPLSSPLTEEQIEDVLHDLVAGVTGLPGKMVRPRWQPRPPKQPEHTVDWCAIGVADADREGFAAVIHNSMGQGTDTVIAWETLDVLASFYGPRALDLAGRLRDGLAIEQNRTALRQAGLALGGMGRMVKVPELVNNAWLRRVDLPLTLRNEARRTFGVLNLLDAPVTAKSDDGLTVHTTPMI
jgi:hypothetical protein